MDYVYIYNCIFSIHSSIYDVRFSIYYSTLYMFRTFGLRFKSFLCHRFFHCYQWNREMVLLLHQRTPQNWINMSPKHAEIPMGFLRCTTETSIIWWNISPVLLMKHIWINIFHFQTLIDVFLKLRHGWSTGFVLAGSTWSSSTFISLAPWIYRSAGIRFGRHHFLF